MGTQCELVLGAFYVVRRRVYLLLKVLMPRVLVLGVPRVLVPGVLMPAIHVPEVLVPGMLFLA